MSIIKTTVKVDTSSVSDRLNSVIGQPDFKTEVHQVFAETIDPWVPYDTGALSKDIRVDSLGVTYTKDYAAKQYYGDEFHHQTTHHPLATAHWDKVAMQTEKDALALKIRAILLRRLGNG